MTKAIVTTGEKSDGHYLKELVKKSKETGMVVNTVIGDTAYSGKENLQYAQAEEFQLISRLNPNISGETSHRKVEFEFSKDAGMYVCPAGHMAIRKARTGKKNQAANQAETYSFDIEKCKVCPMREGCYKEGAKSKTYSIRVKSTEHKEQIRLQETDEFKTLSKKRYKIEAKNSEIKNPHGYKTAKSVGLFGMEIQGAITIFAVNLKRILKLLND
ncbi:hypothetical protein D1953_11830 [Peribacillus asahii]|uniref:Transposase DDE domain-containing protein n=1 Tax=Peribacillus asahii TaxID=228899 RepID=A0A398B5C9_9BACI|nr:hypothetical protein D1953_11830 [Peribacillus asahii]